MFMKASERIGMLMFRHMRNELSAAESKELLAWRSKSPAFEAAFQEATDWDHVLEDLQWSAQNSDWVLEKIKQRFPEPWRPKEELPRAKVRLLYRFLATAAVVLWLMLSITYKYSSYNKANISAGRYAGSIIAPDGNIEDISNSAFQDFMRGFKGGAANATVVQHDSGEMEYIASNNPNAPADERFELRTYRGNAFILQLPGIGKIWVNAASNIWYPANLTADTLRIKLSGEAYFDIPNKPVVIEVRSTVNGQRSTTIRESGAFNIHAYPDDSLKIGRDEQSAAWKNDRIFYENVSLKTILNEISRWYNVDVEYPAKISDKKYSIDLPRDAKFSNVIRVLEQQGVHFLISGRTIYVQ
jgi:hypothetical protein